MTARAKHHAHHVRRSAEAGDGKKGDQSRDARQHQQEREHRAEGKSKGHFEWAKTRVVLMRKPAQIAK